MIQFCLHNVSPLAGKGANAAVGEHVTWGDADYGSLAGSWKILHNGTPAWRKKKPELPSQPTVI
jgi:hypothetical protein